MKAMLSQPMAGKSEEGCEVRNYIGVEKLKAAPQERDGFPGYCIFHEDGFESWIPKEKFERTYFPIEKSDKITIGDVEKFINLGKCNVATWGDKIAITEFTMPTGWIDIETLSCSDPANYDEGLSKEVCIDCIANNLWNHLDFMIKWANNGLKEMK